MDVTYECTNQCIICTMCLPPYMFAKIAKGGRVPYIGLCRYTYLVPWACHHMFVYMYINHLCSFCLSPYVRKRSLIKRTRRKVSCGKAPTSRDNLGHLSERLLYTFYTTIPLLIMVIVFVLFVLNTTQTNANKIQIKTLRRAEIIRIICQRGLGLFFTTFTVVRWWYAVII